MSDQQATEYERLILASLTEDLPRISEERADREFESVEMVGERPKTEVLVTYVQGTRGRQTERFAIWDLEEFSSQHWMDSPEAVASVIFANVVET